MDSTNKNQFGEGAENTAAPVENAASETAAPVENAVSEAAAPSAAGNASFQQPTSYYPPLGVQQADANKNGLAIASMILGIFGIVLSCCAIISVVCSVVAIVLGIIGLKSEKRSMSIAGIILGGAGLFLTIVVFALITGSNIINEIFEEFPGYDYDYYYRW